MVICIVGRGAIESLCTSCNGSASPRTKEWPVLDKNFTIVSAAVAPLIPLLLDRMMPDAGARSLTMPYLEYGIGMRSMPSLTMFVSS